MTAVSILIKNARLVDAKTDAMGCIGINGEKIDFAGRETAKNYDIVIDAEGKTVMPALVDMHCHLREPGQTQKESIETGMRAAVKGGYCALVAMANTTPVITTPELVAENLQKAQKLALCRLIQAAAAGVDLGDTVPTDKAALRKATNVFSNDGKTIFSDEFMRKLLIDSRDMDFIVSTHCEPEEKIVARDIELLRRTGGNLHVGHISTKKTLEIIRAGKRDGLVFSCEVTPHHLLGHGCGYRVNPPLASVEDTLALAEGIKDGTVDCLSTDHAPHTPADKQNGMAGISNIEYAFQVYLLIFRRHNIPLTRLAQMTSFAPRKLLGLGGGLLEAGQDADLIVADVEKENVIDISKMISRSKNTPFDGYAVRGQVEKTIIKGKIRYDNGQFV